MYLKIVKHTKPQDLDKITKFGWFLNTNFHSCILVISYLTASEKLPAALLKKKIRVYLDMFNDKEMSSESGRSGPWNS